MRAVLRVRGHRRAHRPNGAADQTAVGTEADGRRRHGGWTASQAGTARQWASTSASVRSRGSSGAQPVDAVQPSRVTAQDRHLDGAHQRRVRHEPDRAAGLRQEAVGDLLDGHVPARAHVVDRPRRPRTRSAAGRTRTTSRTSVKSRRAVRLPTGISEAPERSASTMRLARADTAKFGRLAWPDVVERSDRHHVLTVPEPCLGAQRLGGELGGGVRGERSGRRLLGQRKLRRVGDRAVDLGGAGHQDPGVGAALPGGGQQGARAEHVHLEDPQRLVPRLADVGHGRQVVDGVGRGDRHRRQQRRPGR